MRTASAPAGPGPCFSVGDALQGILKLKNINDEGLFSWRPHTFSVSIRTRCLTCRPASPGGLISGGREEEGASYDMSLARSAKAWTSFGPVSSTGFDIDWKSGRVWSLLASSGAECKNWVDHLNEAIRQAAGDTGDRGGQEGEKESEGNGVTLLGRECQAGLTGAREEEARLSPSSDYYERQSSLQGRRSSSPPAPSRLFNYAQSSASTGQGPSGPSSPLLVTSDGLPSRGCSLTSSTTAPPPAPSRHHEGPSTRSPSASAKPDGVVSPLLGGKRAGFTASPLDCCVEDGSQEGSVAHSIQPAVEHRASINQRRSSPGVSPTEAVPSSMPDGRRHQSFSYSPPPQSTGPHGPPSAVETAAKASPAMDRRRQHSFSYSPPLQITGQSGVASAETIIRPTGTSKRRQQSFSYSPPPHMDPTGQQQQQRQDPTITSSSPSWGGELRQEQEDVTIYQDASAVGKDDSKPYDTVEQPQSQTFSSYLTTTPVHAPATGLASSIGYDDDDYEDELEEDQGDCHLGPEEGKVPSSALPSSPPPPLPPDSSCVIPDKRNGRRSSSGPFFFTSPSSPSKDDGPPPIREQDDGDGGDGDEDQGCQDYMPYTDGLSLSNDPSQADSLTATRDRAAAGYGGRTKLDGDDGDNELVASLSRMAPRLVPPIHVVRSKEEMSSSPTGSPPPFRLPEARRRLSRPSTEPSYGGPTGGHSSSSPPNGRSPPYLGQAGLRGVEGERHQQEQTLLDEARLREARARESEQWALTRVAELEKDLCRSNEHLKATLLSAAKCKEQWEASLKSALERMQEATEKATKLRTTEAVMRAETDTLRELELEQVGARLGKEVRVACEHDQEAAVAELRNKHEAEVCRVRMETEKKMEKEVERVKAQAAKRERDIGSDVKELQELYQKRLGHLERMLKDESKNVVEARREVATLQLGRAADRNEMLRLEETIKVQKSEIVQQAAQYRAALETASKQKQELREQVSGLEEEVRKLTQELRLANCQVGETKRQMVALVVENESAVRAQREVERRADAATRELAIVSEELSMLENETARLQQDKHVLAAAVVKLDKMVYGSGSKRTNRTITDLLRLHADASALSASPPPIQSSSTHQQVRPMTAPASGTKVSSVSMSEGGPMRSRQAPIAGNVAGRKAAAGAPVKRLDLFASRSISSSTGSMRQGSGRKLSGVV